MSTSYQAEEWMLCSQCDLTILLPAIAPGHRARCPRCHSTLFTYWDDSRKRATGYTVAALCMLLLANFFPFISIDVASLSNQITLWQIPGAMIKENYVSLAVFFLLFAQIIPAFCMLAILLLSHQLLPGRILKAKMAWLLFQLKAWGMAEIFLAGVMVSFVKLMAYGGIGLGAGFIPWCLFCLLQLRAFMCIDKRLLWQQIAPLPALPSAPVAGISGLEQGLRSCGGCTAILPANQVQCPRCYSRGAPRRHQSLQWTLALLLTSAMLYFPANLVPVMVIEAPGSKTTSTIMSGIMLLWRDGSYPVALIIFIASIMGPSLKMLALGWLCWNTAGFGHRDSKKMHLIYEMVEFVGRWSMIDVFVIAVLSSLVRIGRLMNVDPGSGILFFALVVIITMIAAMAFDPRLMWDRRRGYMAKELRFAGE